MIHDKQLKIVVIKQAFFQNQKETCMLKQGTRIEAPWKEKTCNQEVWRKRLHLMINISSLMRSTWTDRRNDKDDQVEERNK